MIYLDHNATTPILPEVLEAMMPYLTTEWGNPSSSYRFGSKLKTVLETARQQVAHLLNAHPREILFTSCATESNNAAIHAALKANPTKRYIVTSAVDHAYGQRLDYFPAPVSSRCAAAASQGDRCSGYAARRMWYIVKLPRPSLCDVSKACG